MQSEPLTEFRLPRALVVSRLSPPWFTANVRGDWRETRNGFRVPVHCVVMPQLACKHFVLNHSLIKVVKQAHFGTAERNALPALRECQPELPLLGG
jgi:hypothetical protein